MEKVKAIGLTQMLALLFLFKFFGSFQGSQSVVYVTCGYVTIGDYIPT